MSYVPESGDIIEIELARDAHALPTKKLVLVLSPKAFNATLGLSWVSPITFIKSRHLFQLNLPEELKTHGTVKLEQLMSVDVGERRGRFVEAVPAAFLKRCQTTAGRVLGF